MKYEKLTAAKLDTLHTLCTKNGVIPGVVIATEADDEIHPFVAYTDGVTVLRAGGGRFFHGAHTAVETGHTGGCNRCAETDLLDPVQIKGCIRFLVLGQQRVAQQMQFFHNSFSVCASFTSIKTNSPLSFVELLGEF